MACMQGWPPCSSWNRDFCPSCRKLDIKVVDGTNTKDEKAQYISECYGAFERLIGPLHEESYIYVQDVREQAYGYGGQTQEYRYIRNKP